MPRACTSIGDLGQILDPGWTVCFGPRTYGMGPAAPRDAARLPRADIPLRNGRARYTCPLALAARDARDARRGTHGESRREAVRDRRRDLSVPVSYTHLRAHET